jgi:hypothetical protein
MYVLHLSIECQGCFCVRLGWRFGDISLSICRYVRNAEYTKSIVEPFFCTTFPVIWYVVNPFLS